MNLEREAMKSRLASLEEEQKKLTLKGEGLTTAIRQGLNTALCPFEELEIPQVAQQMDELVMAWAALAKLRGDIARLIKELR